MEREARYALVGVVSALLLIVGGLFALGLARYQLNRAYDVYNIDFQGPIRGVSPGGEVFFNGIKVGEVTRLRLDARDPNRVLARIRIASDAPVRTDSGASLEPLGVTGVNYVQLTAGTLDRPLLKLAAPSGSTPTIHASRSRLETLLEGGGTLLARSLDSLDRVNALLSAHNVASISSTLEDVAALSGRVRSQARLLDDLDATLRATDTAALRISDLATRSRVVLDGPGASALSELSQAAVQIRATAGDLRTTLAQIATPAETFATRDLPQLARGVATLQKAAASLDRVVGEVEQDPRAFITRAPAQTIEVRP